LHVDSPILKHLLQVPPFEVLLLTAGSALLDEHGKLEETNFFGRQPAPREGRCVDEEEETHHTENDTQQSLQDEDPPPSFKTTDTVHLGNGGGEQAGEGARQCAGAVEV
jgi:hypothetical protein